MRVAEKLDWKGLIKVHNFLEPLLVYIQRTLQGIRFNRQETNKQTNKHLLDGVMVGQNSAECQISSEYF
jgi:hypothetical protein